MAETLKLVRISKKSNSKRGLIILATQKEIFAFIDFLFTENAEDVE